MGNVTLPWRIAAIAGVLKRLWEVSFLTQDAPYVAYQYGHLHHCWLQASRYSAEKISTKSPNAEKSVTHFLENNVIPSTRGWSQVWEPECTLKYQHEKLCLSSTMGNILGSINLCLIYIVYTLQFFLWHYHPCSYKVISRIDDYLVLLVNEGWDTTKKASLLLQCLLLYQAAAPVALELYQISSPA